MTAASVMVLETMKSHPEMKLAELGDLCLKQSEFEERNGNMAIAVELGNYANGFKGMAKGL